MKMCFPVYRSRLGVLELAPDSAPSVAMHVIAADVSATLRLGRMLRISATAPATCGVAIDVPVDHKWPVSLCTDADAM